MHAKTAASVSSTPAVLQLRRPSFPGGATGTADDEGAVPAALDEALRSLTLLSTIVVLGSTNTGSPLLFVVKAMTVVLVPDPSVIDEPRAIV